MLLFAGDAMITIKVDGDFSGTKRFFERLKELIHKGRFDEYGEMGVNALMNATPVDTGRTANSWRYVIKHYKDHSSIIWCNDNVQDGYNVAVLLQYGHATSTGYFVDGIDYINPALKPVFDEIAFRMWREVRDL